MATHTFKNAGLDAATQITAANTNYTLYTASVNTQSIVHSIVLANQTNASVAVSLFVKDTSANLTFDIMKGALITPTNSLIFDEI